jgi:hypothetical protein
MSFYEHALDLWTGTVDSVHSAVDIFHAISNRKK